MMGKSFHSYMIYDYKSKGCPCQEDEKENEKIILKKLKKGVDKRKPMWYNIKRRKERYFG